MKTIILSAVMFLLTLAFVITNTVLLQNLFADINDMLGELPKNNAELAAMDSQSAMEYSKTLSRISKKWKKWETYIYVTLEHDVSGEFYDNFLPAQKYFDAGDYPSYLAYLSSSKDILRQIAKNESFSFGTVL